MFSNNIKKRTIVILTISHLFIGAIGFGLGIYFLPILIAPDAPSSEHIAEIAKDGVYTGTFSRQREDSDRLHWGEGEVSLNQNTIVFSGRLAPGPDYRLYLSPQFLETEEHFNRIKSEMIYVGDIKTFENFQVDLTETIDLSNFNTVVVWCEVFGQFITSAQYRKPSSG